MRIKLLIPILLFSYSIKAQTFSTSVAVPIPDYPGAQVCSPITVSGVGTINSSYGVATVCMNISHTWDGDLVIILKAPDGSTVSLSSQNGGSGDNYTSTCFSMSALSSITSGTAPFSGSYKPQGSFTTVNNGQNANGTWSLCAQDMASTDVGTINSWSITFDVPPPPPPPPPGCNGLAAAGNTCSVATPTCDLNGYCGSTAVTYTADYWPELGTAFCGSIENNSFITFVPSSSTVSLNVYIWNSLYAYGIQIFVFTSSGNCSGTITSYGCSNEIYPTGAPPGGTPVNFNLTGLTPGNTYYMMFDGYAGDICDYQLVVNSGATPTCVTPTTLLSFTGKLAGSQTQLQWQTTAEINSSHFIIEHSNDGSFFTAIGTTPAAGNSNSLKNYSFTDRTPNSGLNYYRLKMMDRDNKFSYSQVERVNLINNSSIYLYPNPARDHVAIEHPASSDISQIKIIDMMGRVVLLNILEKGATKTIINLKSLASGSYKILWSGDGNSASKTLVIE
jgi:subtilisin-like proprotein convertase family protein